MGSERSDGCGSCRDDRIASLDQGAISLLANRAVLPAGMLQTTRLKDANQKDPSNAAIQSIEFHPNGVVLLTAGLDKKLKFFQASKSTLLSTQPTALLFGYL